MTHTPDLFILLLAIGSLLVIKALASEAARTLKGKRNA